VPALEDPKEEDAMRRLITVLALVFLAVGGTATATAAPTPTTAPATWPVPAWWPTATGVMLMTADGTRAPSDIWPYLCRTDVELLPEGVAYLGRLRDPNVTGQPPTATRVGMVIPWGQMVNIRQIDATDPQYQLICP
jgi:hypothetical protein